jgi:hypothetical protein
MSADDENAVATIADAIRRYLVTHPAAADTADGIQRWWLLPLQHEEPLALVELALDRLVDEGVMRRVVMEDGRVIYSHAHGPA